MKSWNPVPGRVPILKPQATNHKPRGGRDLGQGHRDGLEAGPRMPGHCF